MNHDEHPDDGTLTGELRDSLAEVAVPERPPLAAITDKGRVHRRRLASFAGLAGTVAAALIALTLGLAGVSVWPPPAARSRPGPPSPSPAMPTAPSR